MADARVASITALDAYLVDVGQKYDGADGFIGTLTHTQLKELIRVVDTVNGHVVVTSGVITIVPAPSDTQGD